MIRKAKSTVSAKRLRSGEPDLEFREDWLVYFRTIDRQLGNEMGGETRWGDEDTYDRTRKQGKGSKYNDKGGNGTSGTFRGRDTKITDE